LGIACIRPHFPFLIINRIISDLWNRRVFFLFSTPLQAHPLPETESRAEQDRPPNRMSNDRWIACFACFLFAFIAITSQVFIFWPWLFGAEFFPSSSSSSSQDSHVNVGGLSGFMDTEDERKYDGESEGYLTMMWSNLNVRALLYLVPFNFSLGMLCWNYYLTMMTDPGSPPLDWVKELAIDIRLIHIGASITRTADDGTNPLTDCVLRWLLLDPTN